jgi:hypothetical protein
VTEFRQELESGFEEREGVLRDHGGGAFGVSVRAFYSRARVPNSCRCPAARGMCRLCRVSRIRSVFLYLCLTTFRTGSVAVAHVWVEVPQATL